MIKKYTAPFHLIQSVPSHLRVTMKGAPPNPMGTEYAAGISIHAPAKGATAILAKIQLKISAKINNFFFFYTIFPLYNLLLIHKIHFICIFFWCESPGIFMSAPDSHPTSAAFKHFCHNINVSSTAIPLSTPMCSTFV